MSNGSQPTASDCLFILRAAVASETCSPECSCNTNGAGGITASDALVCLKKAVGQAVALNCHCGVGPVGDEFQLNTYTTNDQIRPIVAADANGNFIVAWESIGSSGSDLDGSSIQAQRFLSTGVPSGSEFQVNAFTTSQQAFASAAVDGDGNFVVAWDNTGATDSDASSNVRARRFDDTGTAIGTEFQVNSYTTFTQASASVGIDGAGNFVVVWQSYGSSGSDTSRFSIQGQRYDSSGAPVGTEFQINTYTTDSQSAPALAVGSSGDFVVVWTSAGSSGPDSDFTIQGQRFDQSGGAVGSEFGVNTYTTDGQGGAAVAVGAAGGFVVVWSSYRSDGSDPTNSIQGQRFDESGNPAGTQFQVNTSTTGYQANTSVAAIAGGGFVVVWDSQGSNGSDSGYSVQGQFFDASAAPLGTEFQVNTYTTSYQFLADLAPGVNGSFVVVWESEGSAGSDSAGFSVQGQRFE